MTLDDFRERGNVYLYKSKSRNLGILKILKLFVSSTALVILAIYYGYPYTPDSDILLMNIMRMSFGFYVFHYLIKLIYDFHPWEFIKRTWFEAIIMVILVLEGASHLLFDTLIHEPIVRALSGSMGTDLSLLFIQIYFFVVVIADLMRKGRGIRLRYDSRYK